ncbi:unnamed protein product, partial [Pleuronectes platessa]
MISSDNFEEYLRLSVSLLKLLWKKIATLLKPDKEISHDGDHIVIRPSSTFKTTTWTSRGQEFEEDLSGVDDRKCMVWRPMARTHLVHTLQTDKLTLLGGTYLDYIDFATRKIAISLSQTKSVLTSTPRDHDNRNIKVAAPRMSGDLTCQETCLVTGNGDKLVCSQKRREGKSRLEHWIEGDKLYLSITAACTSGHTYAKFCAKPPPDCSTQAAIQEMFQDAWLACPQSHG